jgi:RNA-directed DNA polymerase
MGIEASPVSGTAIQDASVLESCVQRKFAPTSLWTESMSADLQKGVKGVKWHGLIDKVSRLETLSWGGHKSNITPGRLG